LEFAEKWHRNEKVGSGGSDDRIVQGRKKQ